MWAAAVVASLPSLAQPFTTAASRWIEIKNHFNAMQFRPSPVLERQFLGTQAKNHAYLRRGVLHGNARMRL